jgi:hypothetical protein
MVVSRPRFQNAIDTYAVRSNVWPLELEQLDEVMDKSLLYVRDRTVSSSPPPPVLSQCIFEMSILRGNLLSIIVVPGFCRRLKRDAHISISKENLESAAQG